MEAGGEEVRPQLETSCRNLSVQYSDELPLLLQEEELGVFAREGHWTTSLCTGSAEINSWAWLVCSVYSQRSFHCTLSLQSEFFFKLSLIVCRGFISISNEGHRRTVQFLLVPEHHHKGAVIMVAANLDLSALHHYLSRRLVKCDSIDLTCGESSSR